MAVRIGRQTPTQSVILKYKKTLGDEAADYYDKSSRKAQKWQRSLLRDIMAVNKDGLWVHPEFGYSVPRRNGKNEVIVMREIWGLHHGERMCHTAHRTSTSHSAWERLVKVLKEAGYEELGRHTKDEVPSEFSFHTSKKYGLETVEFANGGTITFRTRSDSGGLGEGYDLLVIDEAQEYTENQQSTLIYTVSDSKNPQTILCGTPNTMVSSGTVFTQLRDDVLKGETVDTGWAEWGVTEEPADLWDKELWYRTNPSLGTILTERKIAKEIRSDRLDFIIQRLGLWYKYSLKSAISRDEWLAYQCEDLPDLSGKISIGVKHGKTLNNISVSIAVKTWDDRIFVESIDCRPFRDGYAWILAFISKSHPASVVVDGAAISTEISEGLKAMKCKTPIIFPTVGEIIQSSALFEQALADGRLCHSAQHSLVNSVANCEHRPIGQNGGFGYKSINEKIDVSLLESVTLAVFGCINSKPEKKKQSASY